MKACFFALLRSGIWGTKADSRLFEQLSADEWEELYRMACKQAVLGVTFDGILTLPEQLRPSRPLYLRWAIQTAKIEQANQHLSEVTARLFRLYHDAGLHPVLMKGQGIGQYYPNPMHRQCGDIDVFIGKKDYAKANALLTERGAVCDHLPNNKHCGFTWDNVHVENHRIICNLDHPVTNKRLQRIVQSWYPQSIEHDLPPATFNALFIFLHAFYHLKREGVGLRQLCDWACLLAKRKADIDGALLVDWLDQLKLTYAAQAMGHLAVAYLGLSPEYLPFATVKTESDKLISDILVGGNFGFYSDIFTLRPRGFWSGKYFAFRQIMHRSSVLHDLAPAEVSWTVYRRFTQFFKYHLFKVLQ